MVNAICNSTYTCVCTLFFIILQYSIIVRTTSLQVMSCVCKLIIIVIPIIILDLLI